MTYEEKIYFDIVTKIYKKRSKTIKGFTKAQLFNFIKPFLKDVPDEEEKEIGEYIYKRLIKEKILSYFKDIHGKPLIDSFHVNIQVTKSLIRKYKLRRIVNE